MIYRYIMTYTLFTGSVIRAFRLVIYFKYRSSSLLKHTRTKAWTYIRTYMRLCSHAYSFVSVRAYGCAR